MAVTPISATSAKASEIYRMNSSQQLRGTSLSKGPAKQAAGTKSDSVQFSREAFDRLQELKQNQINDTLEAERANQDSDIKLEESLRTLELEGNASRDEIKKAYHYAIQQYHPDKHAHLPPEFRKLAETKAKQITQAYKTLLEHKAGQPQK
jgi:hypothetical protein